MDLAEGKERRKLDRGLHLAFEQHWQDEDILRRRLPESGCNLYVVSRYVREKYRFLLESRLSYQSFPEMEAIRNVLPLLVRVARDELENRRVVFMFHDVERAVMRGHQRRELGHDQLGHRLEIFLTLHHP